MADKLTAILIGGTGATGKEVLKELNATELISKIIFISRRALEFPDQPKVRNLIEVLYRYRSFWYQFVSVNGSFPTSIFFTNRLT